MISKNTTRDRPFSVLKTRLVNRHHACQKIFQKLSSSAACNLESDLRCDVLPTGFPNHTNCGLPISLYNHFIGTLSYLLILRVYQDTVRTSKAQTYAQFTTMAPERIGHPYTRISSLLEFDALHNPFLILRQNKGISSWEYPLFVVTAKPIHNLNKRRTILRLLRPTRRNQIP